MEYLLVVIAVATGLLALFKISDILFQQFYRGAKNLSLTRWLALLFAAIILFYSPDVLGIAALLLGCILFMLGKMLLLVQSIQTNS